MMNSRGGARRWLRWLVLDHLIVVVLIVMVAIVFSILFVSPTDRFGQGDYQLQRSLPASP